MSSGQNSFDNIFQLVDPDDGRAEAMRVLLEIRATSHFENIASKFNDTTTPGVAQTLLLEYGQAMIMYCQAIPGLNDSTAKWALVMDEARGESNNLEPLIYLATQEVEVLKFGAAEGDVAAGDLAIALKNILELVQSRET